MYLQKDIALRIAKIRDICPRSEIPTRATTQIPNDLDLTDLHHLSDAVWLVLLDIIAKQLKRHELSGSQISKRAVKRRLHSILLLVDDLERYKLLDRRNQAYRALDDVRQLVASELLW